MRHPEELPACGVFAWEEEDHEEGTSDLRLCVITPQQTTSLEPHSAESAWNTCILVFCWVILHQLTSSPNQILPASVSGK